MDTLDFIYNEIGAWPPKNIYTGNVDIPRIYEISNVSRLDLIKWFRMLDFKVGAEIGVACAEYSKLICEINPQIKLFGIDSWIAYKEYSDFKLKETFNYLEHDAIKRMVNYIQRNRFVMIKKFSMDAIREFKDNSLDFVYIDANHEYKFVLEDIIEWTKKVRPGGIVAGHDYVKIKRSNYSKWGVIEAVNQYVTMNDIKPLFILGTKAEVPGVVREGARSWMFIKP